MAETKPSVNFEQSMAQLEQALQRLEQEDLTLDQSLQQFEQGIGLIRQCRQLLTEAEQKVSILLDDDSLKPFAVDE